MKSLKYKKIFLKKSNRVVSIIIDDYQKFLEIILKLGQLGYRHINCFIQYESCIRKINITEDIDILYRQYDNIKVNYNDDNFYYTDDMKFMAIADNDDNITIAVSREFLLKLFIPQELFNMDAELQTMTDRTQAWKKIMYKLYSNFLFSKNIGRPNNNP